MVLAGVVGAFATVLSNAWTDAVLIHYTLLRLALPNGESIISFPVIYLHLTYAYTDRNTTLVLNNSNLCLEINGKELDLSTTDKIIINGSVALTRNVIPLVISPNYYNVIFISKEFGEVSFSSLVYPNLKNIILERLDNEIINYDYFFLY